MLKDRFTTGPILTHFQGRLETRIETDASDYAVAAVLLQRGDDGLWHPVAFASRTLLPAEKNYEVHNKEMLGVVYACLEWHPLLLSTTLAFTVLTDAKSLQWFMTTKVLNRRQVWWAERLADFDFTITYRPGTSNNQADPMSRRDDVYPSGGDSSFATKNPENTRQFFQPHHLRNSTNEYLADNLLEELRKLQALDEEISSKKSNIEGKDPEEKNEIEDDTGKPDKYTIQNGLVLVDGRIWVPDNDTIKLRILESRHDHPLAGHPGRTKTLQLLRRDFHWDGIMEYVNQYVSGCLECIRNKTLRHKKYGYLNPPPIPTRPWESLSMDFIDQLPLSQTHDSILVIVCRMTKMALFIPTHTTVDSKGLAKLFIQHVFSKHGVPNNIVSDLGNKYTSIFWTALSKALRIQQNLSTAYHPETDGQTERVNQVVGTYLHLYINYDQDNWADYLPLAEYAYNNATHSSSGESPFFLLNKGFHPTLDVQISATTNKSLGVSIQKIKDLHEHTKAEIAKALEKNKRNTDAHRQETPKYKVGDEVFLSTQNIRTTRPTKKFAERRLGPFKILEVVSSLAMRLHLPPPTT